MPIEHTSPGAALRAFAERLNGVLNATLTQTRLVHVLVEERMTVSFRQAGTPTVARLSTRFGEMQLFLGQTCIAIELEGGQFRLGTAAYKYTLTPTGASEPLFRWEYIRDWPKPGDHWCRHHLQGDIAVQIGTHSVHLDEIHLPTGFVTVEEVIRFCLHDLGVTALSDDWHERLEQSYRAFKEQFGSV